MNENEKEKSYHNNGRPEGRRSRRHSAKPSPYAYRINHGSPRRARRMRGSRGRVFLTGLLVTGLMAVFAFSKMDFQESYRELFSNDVLSTIEPLHIEIYQHSDLALLPEMFLEHNVDNKDLVIAYSNGTPSVEELGDFVVTVSVQDKRGEIREIDALLSVRRGSDLPEILGVTDIIVVLGAEVSYMDNVSATDYYGNVLEVTVDMAAVDIHNVGEYPVIYQAVDQFGHVGEIWATVFVSDQNDLL